VRATSDELTIVAVAPSHGHFVAARVPLPGTRRPVPGAPVHVANAETALAGGVHAVGRRDVRAAGAADLRIVAIAILVHGVVGALAGALPLELRAEALVLLLADRPGLRLRDAGLRDGARLGGVVEAIDEEARQLDRHAGELLIGD